MNKIDLENKILRLAIEVTNTCNSRCRFCAYRYMKRPKYILSNEEFKFFVEKYAEYGGGELKLTPVVGDPLMDKDLIEKIKIAKDTRVITHLYTYTNLIGLQNFNVNELLLSGIDKIDISTCVGSKEMYKKLFGVDRYLQVMENLKELIKKNNVLGRPVKIEVVSRCDKPYEKMWASKDYQEIEGLLGHEIREIENYDNWTGLIKKEDIPDGQEFRKVDNMSEPCSLFYKGAIVFANGDVGICWCRDVEATLIIGNLYKESLDEIWGGKRLKNFRDNWVKGNVPKICKNCYQYTPLSKILG